MNKGLEYEIKINNLLRKNGIQRLSFHGAGTDSNAPDAEITVNKKYYKVEIKLDNGVDYGQGSLVYNLDKKKWELAGSNTAAAEEMRKLLTKLKVLDIVNKQWGPKGPPKKFTVVNKLYTAKDVEFDYTNFKDIFIDVPMNAVANYYNSKNTYYIQVGKFGFYYMGKDIAKLGIPEFKNRLQLRIRIKKGGSSPLYNYRFSTAITAKTGMLKKSTADLEDVEYLKLLKMRKEK